jgi:hypothetical protein
MKTECEGMRFNGSGVFNRLKRRSRVAKYENVIWRGHLISVCMGQSFRRSSQHKSISVELH